MDDVTDESILSLKEKLKRHYNKKKQKAGIPNVELFNLWAPIFFFVVYLGASAWGVFVVVPASFVDYTTFVLLEAFTIYVFFQILINWLLLKFTDSTYIPEVYGTQSPQHDSSFLSRPIAEDYQSGLENRDINGSPDVDLESESSASSKTQDGHAYQVFIPVHVSETKIDRKAFPYWSWMPCVMCNKPRPPRCHHCTLCKRCVLKRDHHCFFARNCVGLNNQRYFLYFLFWCVVMTAWGSFIITKYVFTEILPLYSYWDFVFPISLVRAFMGYFPWPFFHLTFVNLGTIALLVLSSVMLSVNVTLLVKGVTSFEHDQNIKITDTRNLAGRLRAVLGENWALSVFIPGYAQSKPCDDPVNWPHIKAS